MTESENKIAIGWSEWVALPELNIPAVKAKVDTGARSSSIHTFMIRTFTIKGQRKVCFGLHPLQNRTDLEVYAIADVIDERWVTSSGGQKEKRLFIQTKIEVGDIARTVELNLTKRETMKFRMLLGRTSLGDNFLVNPSQSCLLGNAPKDCYEVGKKIKS